MQYLGRRERATWMLLWGVGIITPRLPILGHGIQVASTYSWSSGAAAGEGAEAVKSNCRGETCWGYGSELGVLRRRVGREQKIRIGNKTLLVLLIAEQLVIYVSCIRLLDRAVALVGLVETCPCILDWKPFCISELTARLSFQCLWPQF